MSTIPIRIAPDVPSRFLDALATLPRSFGVGPGAPAQVVSGGPGWTSRAAAAIGGPARGVLVADPVPEPTGVVVAATLHNDTPLVIATMGRHDPVVPALRELLASADGALLECRILVHPQSAAALQGAVPALLRAIDSRVLSVTARSSSAHGWQAVAHLQSGRDAVVSADLSTGGPPSAHLRLVGGTGLIESVIPLGSRTRPALLRVVDTDGERIHPTDFTTGATTALRALHQAMTTGVHDDSLAQFGEDLAVAAELT